MAERRRFDPVAVAVAATVLGLAAVVAGCGSTAAQPGTVSLLSADPHTKGTAPGSEALTATIRCPAVLPQALVADEPGVDKLLVPEAADRLLLCAYGPVGAGAAGTGTPGGATTGAGSGTSGVGTVGTASAGTGSAGTGAGVSVVRVLVTDRSSIDRLRSALDRLAPAPREALPCPMARGYTVLEVFADTARDQVVEVRQTLDGCRIADNGHRTGWVGSSDAGRVVLSLLPAGYRQEAPTG